MGGGPKAVEPRRPTAAGKGKAPERRPKKHVYVDLAKKRSKRGSPTPSPSADEYPEDRDSPDNDPSRNLYVLRDLMRFATPPQKHARTHVA